MQALALLSFEPVGAAATTNSNGIYTLVGLPEGIEVIIVATKTTDDGLVRVSNHVPEVGANTVADLDPVTTIGHRTIELAHS